MKENYLLMGDVLAGITRSLERAYHDPANRGREMTEHLERCITLVGEVQQEIAYLPRLAGQQRRKRQGVRERRGVRASMN